MTTTWTLVASPVDALLLTASPDAVTGVYFEPHKGVGHRHRTAGHGWQRRDDDPLLAEAARQLTEYFAGGRRAFDLPLAAVGTPFQRNVWRALTDIAYGTTRSYGDVAAALGLSRAASRAVGLANGANPLSVVVPCHRVVGADGSLTGFGGGIERKRFLLDLEADRLF